MSSSHGLADANCRRFIGFRVLFNARFYYPVIAVLFLDLGLTAAEYTLLNFLWALIIVGAEVPSGVLADRLGRRPLVIAAGVLMVLEMMTLCLAPQNGGWLLLGFCLVNRILSGLAEAMASGADESLVYDSLVQADRRDEWPDLLRQLMVWQSIAMVLAMLIGSAVYDPNLLNKLGLSLGFSWKLDASTTMRFPIYLNLLTAFLVLMMAWGMREPVREAVSNLNTMDAFRSVGRAGWWILSTPIALFIILGGMILDSAIRLFLTFSSAYFRLIELPDASFGVMGALMAGVGLLVAPLMRHLGGTVVAQYRVLIGLTLVGLLGLLLELPLWGALFALILAAAFSALNYFVSNGLNQQVESHQRATVLSFKGLVFNLGYGFVSLLFAEALHQFSDPARPDSAFGEALVLLPWWVSFAGLLLMLGFVRRRLSH